MLARWSLIREELVGQDQFIIFKTLCKTFLLISSHLDGRINSRDGPRTLELEHSFLLEGRIYI